MHYLSEMMKIRDKEELKKKKNTIVENCFKELGTVVCIYNHHPWKMEARVSGVHGQPLLLDTLSQ